MFLQHTQKKTKGHRKLLAVVDVSITLIVMMISQVFAYVPTHQVYTLKMYGFFVFQLHLNKELKKISGSVFRLGSKKECGLRRGGRGNSEHRICTFLERAIE